MESKKILMNLGLLGTTAVSLMSCASEIGPVDLYPEHTASGKKLSAKEQRIVQTYQSMHNSIQDNTICMSNQKPVLQYALAEYASSPEGKKRLANAGAVKLEATHGFNVIRGMYLAKENRIKLSSRTTTAVSSLTGNNRDLDDFECTNVVAHEILHVDQTKRGIMLVSSRASFENNIISWMLREAEARAWDMMHQTIETEFHCFYCNDNQKIAQFMSRDLIAEAQKRAKKKNYPFYQDEFCATDIPYRLQQSLLKHNGDLDKAERECVGLLMLDLMCDTKTSRNDKTPAHDYYAKRDKWRMLYSPKSVLLAAHYSLSRTGDSPSVQKTKAYIKSEYNLDWKQLEKFVLSPFGKGLYQQYRPEAKNKQASTTIKTGTLSFDNPTTTEATIAIATQPKSKNAQTKALYSSYERV